MRNQAQVAAVFDALGEPIRRQILELLTDGPSPVHELAERLPVNRPAVSKHLRVLSRAGLTGHRSVGTSNVYYLRRDGLEAAKAWLNAGALGEAADAESGEDAEPAPATWAALLFTPAQADAGASVFEDSRFSGHITFLNQMEAAGYLVAAGPMVDQDGAGMTILRLPGDGRLEEVERLAQEDASVTSGLFAVTIRPWRVFFAPGVAA